MISKRVLFGLLALAPSCLLAQFTIYEETFAGSSDGPMAPLGWVGHITRGDNLVNGALIPSGSGASYDNSYINAGGAASSGGDTSGTTGFTLFVAAGYHHLLAWTDEVSFNPANYTDIQFEFWTRNSGSIQTARIAVQIGGNWYASDQAYTQTLGGSTWEQHLYDYDVTGSNWLTLNFDGTTTTSASAALSLGAALVSDLPSGSITAAGLYLENPNFALASQNMRIDPFRITGTAAVPEPSTYALLLGLSALGLLIVRRRR